MYVCNMHICVIYTYKRKCVWKKLLLFVVCCVLCVCLREKARDRDRESQTEIEKEGLERETETESGCVSVGEVGMVVCTGVQVWRGVHFCVHVQMSRDMYTFSPCFFATFFCHLFFAILQLSSCLPHTAIFVSSYFTSTGVLIQLYLLHTGLLNSKP